MVILILLPLLTGFGTLSRARLHNSFYTHSCILLEFSASPRRVLFPFCHTSSHRTGKATASSFGSVTIDYFIINNSHDQVIDIIRRRTFFCLHRFCFLINKCKEKLPLKMFLENILSQEYTYTKNSKHKNYCLLQRGSNFIKLV